PGFLPHPRCRRLPVALAPLPLTPGRGRLEPRRLDDHGLRAVVRSPPGPLDSLPGQPAGGAVLGVLPGAPADLRHAAVLAPGGGALLPRRGPGEPALGRGPCGVAASPARRRRLAVRRP